MITQSRLRKRSSASALVLGTLASLFVLDAEAAGDSGNVSSVIEQLGLREAAAPVKERKGWRVPKKIVVLAPGGGGLAPNIRSGLASAAPGAEIVEAPDVSSAAKAATNADIVVGLTSPGGVCEPEIINNAKSLRWIHSMSAGVENCIAIPSVMSRDLLVTNMRGVDSDVIAEHAIAMTLSLAHGLDTFIVDGSKAQWKPQNAVATRMQFLTGKTMLVVGLGGIGTEVAKRAHGLGMKVVATRASGSKGPEFVSYVGKPEELLTLAKTADVIINTAPLTKETTGLFDAKFFAAVKPTAYFINVARGKAVVTDDLMKALNDGRLAGAGLDVVEPEPLPADHPLWKAPNLIITPHISSRSDAASNDRWLVATENLRRYVAGEKMISTVDLKREY
jgi:phosphoglycerate dehydrogenase-like enzyme